MPGEVLDLRVVRDGILVALRAGRRGSVLIWQACGFAPSSGGEKWKSVAATLLTEKLVTIGPWGTWPGAGGFGL